MDGIRTATELGIEQWEVDALMATADYLTMHTKPDFQEDIDRGDTEYSARYGDVPNGRVGPLFDMETVCTRYTCGTAACIGGWVWLLTHAKPTSIKPGFVTYAEDDTERASHYVSGNQPEMPYGKLTPLTNLFYPPEHMVHRDNWKYVTAEEAANVIWHFLRTGDVDWTMYVKEADISARKRKWEEVIEGAPADGWEDEE